MIKNPPWNDSCGGFCTVMGGDCQVDSAFLKSMLLDSFHLQKNTLFTGKIVNIVF